MVYSLGSGWQSEAKQLLVARAASNALHGIWSNTGALIIRMESGSILVSEYN